MAKHYHVSINRRRKYCDRKGFMKNKFDKRPRFPDNSLCIHNCIDCSRNKTCPHLPYT